MMSFFFIVLNFGSPNRVKRGCVVLVIAGLTELFLVGRMWSANSKLQDEVHSPYTELESKGIYMKVQFPFSIMVALFGFLPGILAICFGVSLHAKLTQLQRDSGGRMLNLVPSQPNNYRILQES
ncbi:uncharacterized protein LOC133194787 [Saccostrea echinata]|uniref:uncharacterized protein LOC133194787 n=1 Tax=Saccostrea echinata TaxID=191078 RepID=UPI002A82DDD9|nr:uncharacterized protein LOC133194787 [Saccostrea echinata]